jgi:hypothetical protein
MKKVRIPKVKRSPISNLGPHLLPKGAKGAAVMKVARSIMSKRRSTRYG